MAGGRLLSQYSWCFGMFEQRESCFDRVALCDGRLLFRVRGTLGVVPRSSTQVAKESQEGQRAVTIAGPDDWTVEHAYTVVRPPAAALSRSCGARIRKFGFAQIPSFRQRLNRCSPVAGAGQNRGGRSAESREGNYARRIEGRVEGRAEGRVEGRLWCFAADIEGQLKRLLGQ